MTTEYVNAAGEPISHDDWITEFENRDRRKTVVGDYEVSTIFTGTGPDSVYETVVFDNSPIKTCECCGQSIYHSDREFRYAAEADALAHHDAIVEALRKGEGVPVVACASQISDKKPQSD